MLLITINIKIIFTEHIHYYINFFVFHYYHIRFLHYPNNNTNLIITVPSFFLQDTVAYL